MGLACLMVISAQIVAVPRIQQIQVTQQTGSSCGYHAVFNAKAVETLALQGRQLTAAAVVQEARQYRQHIQRDALLADTIIDLANQLDIENLYCVNGGRGLAFAGSSLGSQDGNQFLADIAAQRQPAHTMIGHFVVNTGGHWVVFSVVKQPGQEPTVLYMDSINTPLSRNRTAQTVGNALLARLGVVAAGRNAVPRPERNVGKNRSRKSNAVANNNSRKVNHVQEHNERDVQVKKEPKKSGFSYKTYIAVVLVSLFLGVTFSSNT